MHIDETEKPTQPTRPRLIRSTLLLSAVGLALACAGCGQSAEEKARNDVCDARADIQKQVNGLENLTLSSATVDQVKSDVNAIDKDLSKIADAQGDLDATRKQRVEKANDTFKTQLNTLKKDLGASTSIQGLRQQLEADIADLGTSYKEAFAPIDCG